MKLAVLGAGAWGTAISLSLASRHDVTLWAREPDVDADLRARRRNQRYLPGHELPATVKIAEHMTDALAGAELTLIATTTAGLRETLRQVRLATSAPRIVWLCKGFEADTAQLPHQVAAAELPDGAEYGALSGPSFADEIARGLPAALTLASGDADFAADAARSLHHPALRVYSSDDLIGVEVGGAVKNVMAIATGICDGLELGQNARAALMTRGLAEITRLGLKLGGRLETFMGLAGAGDLFLTCSGDLSRNRRVGLQLAKGIGLERILRELGHVAEGVYTARAIARLAASIDVEMPITHAVCRVLDENLAPLKAVQELLRREPKAEHR